jgi:hypothetical protein
MNRPLFMKRYTMFFESIRQNPSNPHIDADTLKWLPLMYITVSRGAQGRGERVLVGIDGLDPI